MTAASAATHSTSAMSSKKLWVTNSVMCFTPPPGDRTAAGSSGESFLAAHGLGWHAPNAASLHVTGDNTTFRAVCDENFTLQRTGAARSRLKLARSVLNRVEVVGPPRASGLDQESSNPHLGTQARKILTATSCCSGRKVARYASSTTRWPPGLKA